SFPTQSHYGLNSEPLQSCSSGVGLFPEASLSNGLPAHRTGPCNPLGAGRQARPSAAPALSGRAQCSPHSAPIHPNVSASPHFVAERPLPPLCQVGWDRRSSSWASWACLHHAILAPSCH